MAPEEGQEPMLILLQRGRLGWRPLSFLITTKMTLMADFVVKVAGEPGPDRMSGISRPAAGKNATFRFRN
jgi:hypothetical protein